MCTMHLPACSGMQSGVQGQSTEVNSDEHSALSNSTSEYAPAHVKLKTPMRYTFFMNPRAVIHYIYQTQLS